MKSFDLDRVGVSVLSLSKDEDLIEQIQGYCTSKNVKSAVFTAIGAVEGVVLSFYDQSARQYMDLGFKETLEISSCVGNVFMKGESLFVHTHGVFSRHNGSCVGGHIKSAKVFAAEVHMQFFSQSPLRKLDDATGLHLLSIED